MKGKRNIACHRFLFAETGQMIRLSMVLVFASATSIPLHAEELFVSAAASLADALKEIGAKFEKESNTKVVFNFAASSMLARQIEEGAPADIFFSADEAQMNGLEKKGLIAKETRKSRLSNSLVIVVSAASSFTIQSAGELAEPKVKRIALAD